MPVCHVAIVSRACLANILAGRKTIESRLSLSRVAPYGQITAGDTIYFKASGGAFGAKAVADGVTTITGLRPAAVRHLRRTYEHAILGGTAYWKSKSRAKFATLIHLANITPVSDGPRYRPAGARPSRAAWFVLGQRPANHHLTTIFPNCSPASRRS
ncbi:MAG: hypothetical protein HBSAPP03_04340 [Phycisphaerae bacterium]|nr:MAG: hypothetical protein HBSAPP03_04340 [Phycisphaerae bacterium]